MISVEILAVVALGLASVVLAIVRRRQRRAGGKTTIHAQVSDQVIEGAWWLRDGRVWVRAGAEIRSAPLTPGENAERAAERLLAQK